MSGQGISGAFNVAAKIAQLFGKQDKIKKAYSCMRCEGAAVSTITGSFQAINDANLGGSIVWATNTLSTYVRHELTGGAHEIVLGGTYRLDAALSFSGDDNSTTEFEVTIGVDSGAGVVSKEASVKSFRSTTSTGLTGNMSLVCLPVFKAGDKVYLMIRKNTGSADMNLSGINFTLNRVDFD